MTEDFECAWPADGWALYDVTDDNGGEYLMGKRPCHPQTGSYALWTVGGGQDGTALACGADYPNNADTWAIYGPFDLAGASSATLGVGIWGESEWQGGADCVSDYVFIGGSSDGQSFQGSSACGSFVSGPDGNSYANGTMNLSQWLGDSSVWVAFHFVANASSTFGELHIDNVFLQTDQDSYAAYLPVAMTEQGTIQATERVMTSGGGVIEERDGVRMYVPPGAVPPQSGGADSEVTLSVQAPAELPAALPDWTTGSGMVVQYGPEALQFAYPVSLSLPFPAVTDLA